MSKLTSARAGIPRAKPGATPKKYAMPPKAQIIHDAAVVFLNHGAEMAHRHLGGSLRAKILMPLVLKRAKFIARRAKHFAEVHGIEEEV